MLPAEGLFRIQTAWSIEPPCFVRKVDRKGHWNDAETIQSKVFKPEPNNTISVYRVTAGLDLLRVALALNANRSSKTEPIFLVAIKPDELAEIQVEQTPGQTLCTWANLLHHDLIVTEPTQITGLVQALLAASRTPKKFTTQNMTLAVADATHQGCHAATPHSKRCVCEAGQSVLARLWDWLASAVQKISIPRRGPPLEMTSHGADRGRPRGRAAR